MAARKILQNRVNAKLVVVGSAEHRLTLPPLGRRLVTDQEFEDFDEACLTRTGLVSVADEGDQSEWLEAVPGLVVMALFADFIAGFTLHSPWFWGAGALIVVLLAVLAFKGIKGGVSEAFRWAQQMLSLFGVLLVGAVLPAIALWFASDLNELERGDRFLLFELYDSPSSRGVVLRSLQLSLMAGAAFLPAVLFSSVRTSTRCSESCAAICAAT